ncbi:MAG: hypothetical protein QGF09_04850 [Rhodospirillales bacterium]|jgi:hypothetical protein|nr:hypothetical protein [Rhodospirillales bacterium]
MRKGVILATAAVLSGCSYVDSYEEAVHDREPIYCYQSLAAVECYRTPDHTDEKRLVNYFGPHPSRHERQETEEPKLKAPPPISKWVKDTEPVPRAAGESKPVKASKPAG